MILPQIGTQLTLGFISLHTLGVIEMILLKFSKNLIVSEAGRNIIDDYEGEWKMEKHVLIILAIIYVL